ncbi:interferon beta [Ochotona curzoniae]|uniref:interferon beta n=1 Tax=Ochotona curzoniae TaxID=130825 RepID=UPI001B34632F|nr:interferon beta [Ochotona curzoniae]
MINRCILQIVLLMCFSSIALSMSYNSLQIQLRNSSQKCLDLLKELKGQTEDCLNERMNFMTPKEIRKPQQLRKEDAALVIFEMLNNTFVIFRKNVSSTGWNETVVEHLCSETYSQTHNLKNMSKKFTKKNSMLHLRLKSYYWKILNFLEDKKYSNCAWGLVHLQIIKDLSNMRNLIDSLQN